MEAIGQELDLQDAGAVCDVLDRAAAANLASPQRRGGVVELPAAGRVVITGDLHDSRGNFEAILKLARLDRKPDTTVVFQEVVHGEHLIRGMDFSYRILTQVAALGLAYPGRVIQLLSNHELAQVLGEGILKDGRSVVETFDLGIDYAFGMETGRVRESIGRYIRSLPLAVRSASGVMCAHSLPSPRKRDVFDPAVLERAASQEDLEGPHGSAHLMVWGRNLTQKLADDLGAIWGVKQFVLGHQHAEMGWETVGESVLILNSDHAHGVALELDLSEPCGRDLMCEKLLPLAGV